MIDFVLDDTGCPPREHPVDEFAVLVESLDAHGTVAGHHPGEPGNAQASFVEADVLPVPDRPEHGIDQDGEGHAIAFPGCRSASGSWPHSSGPSYSTASWMETPTWGAASPTPGAASMVARIWVMSSRSSLVPRSAAPTGSAGRRRTGSPHSMMGRLAGLSWLPGRPGHLVSRAAPQRLSAILGSVELSDAMAFARTNRWAVLTTIRSNGLPQLSNVAYHVSDDHVMRISITASRAKYHNLQRRPWAALHVTRPDFFAYAVLEGAVELSPVAARPGDETVGELISYYRALSGEHEDWDAYRAAMVAERRVVVRLTPDRAYGMLSLPAPAGPGSRICDRPGRLRRVRAVPRERRRVRPAL